MFCGRSVAAADDAEARKLLSLGPLDVSRRCPTDVFPRRDVERLLPSISSEAMIDNI
jgi:hypothetical protein